MAMNEVTTPVPGVKRTECWWGFHFTGKKDILLSAGLAQESWFADGSERNKRGFVIRSKRLTVDGRRIWTTVDAKRSTVSMHVEFTEAEAAARRSAQEAAEADAEEKRRLEQLPKSAEAYREEILDLFDRFVGGLIRVADPSETSPRNYSHGYRLHPETISELQRLHGHMINVIETGQIVFFKSAHKAAIAGIRADAAKNDPALQLFMQRATSAPVDSQPANEKRPAK